MKVTHNGNECEVVLAKYADGNTAIRLTQDGMPYATVTINDPHLELAEDEVLIKNYSEGAGMVDALVAAGAVEKQDEILIGMFCASTWLCKVLKKETNE
jgi:hypothetical protein